MGIENNHVDKVSAKDTAEKHSGDNGADGKSLVSHTDMAAFKDPLPAALGSLPDIPLTGKTPEGKGLKDIVAKAIEAKPGDIHALPNIEIGTALDQKHPGDVLPAPEKHTDPKTGDEVTTTKNTDGGQTVETKHKDGSSDKTTDHPDGSKTTETHKKDGTKVIENDAAPPSKAKTVETIHPYGGNIEKDTYDEKGRKREHTEDSGLRTGEATHKKEVYDEKGRLVHEEDSRGNGSMGPRYAYERSHSADYTYDENGNQHKIQETTHDKSPLEPGQTTTTKYNPDGSVASSETTADNFDGQTDPGAMTHKNAEHTQTETMPDGSVKKTSTHGDGSSETQVKHPDGTTETDVKHADGTKEHTSEKRNPPNITTKSEKYDKDGHLLEESESTSSVGYVAQGHTHTTKYSYDANGNRHKTSESESDDFTGKTLTQTYDSQGRLHSMKVHNRDGSGSETEYDESGRKKKETVTNKDGSRIEEPFIYTDDSNEPVMHPKQKFDKDGNLEWAERGMKN